ncbi:hypothetical protein OROGR_012784 [Orobanche gracilis]
MPNRISSSSDDDIFVTIVRGFGRARMTREVIRVLDLVAKFGNTGAPSLKLLNTILDVLVKEDIDIAREFYRKKIMGNGVKGDDYTYGILMKEFEEVNKYVLVEAVATSFSLSGTHLFMEAISQSTNNKDSLADPRTKFGFTVIAHILLSPGLLGPLAYYKSLVNQGKLKHDACQEKVALELDNLLGRLDHYEEDMEEYHANLAKWEQNREKERKRLLMEEANAKQKRDPSTFVNKRRNFLQKWMSRQGKKYDSLADPRTKFGFTVIAHILLSPGLLGPLAYYKSLVNQGKLKHDACQEKVALELDNLLGRLDHYEEDMEEYHANLAKWEQNREKERKRLLMEEANAKQKRDPSTFVNKRRNFLQKWMSSLVCENGIALDDRMLGYSNYFYVPVVHFQIRNDSFEPGVGKWVSYLNREKKLDSLVGQRPTAPPAPKGLYIYGNVGSGKTMLMDMFFSATEGIVRHRRRLHFHEAMLQIHDRMHKVWKGQEMEKSFESSISNWVVNLPFDTKIKEWLVEEERYKQEIKMKNILPAVADEFLADGHKKGASILCFDEIQTVDVFAIVALSGIVSRLLNTGTVLVATSNRAPRDLNQDGMQKEIFQEFLTKLEEHSENILIGSEIDYRRHIAKSSIDKARKACYFWPLDRTKTKEFEDVWNEIVGQSGGSVTSQTLPVMFGRTLEVIESCNGVARFTFEFLCGQPIGAADYIAIAKTYHTIFVADIPVMSMRIRDKARRFITLVDELYNHHCCLYCSAAASIDDLFQGTEDGTLFDLESFQFETEIEGSKLRRDVTAEGNVSSGGTTIGIVSLLSGQEETFAFQRAVSRLIEMQTPFYLEGVGSVHPYFQESFESYVVESENQNITHFISFSILSFSGMGGSTLKGADLLYIVSSTTPWAQLLKEALIHARMKDIDVFCAPNIMDNKDALRDLRFKEDEDVSCYYYLYNYRLKERVKSLEIGLMTM